MTQNNTRLMLGLLDVASLSVKKLICCRHDKVVFRSLLEKLAGQVRSVLALPEFQNIPEPPPDIDEEQP